ncbi:ISxac3 transposase [Synechococcus sp. WH 5701]|nr:ISxac3 transposase [Synechococcus sp. WH 5701]
MSSAVSASGDDLGDHAGTDGAAAFANGEAHALLNGHRADQLGRHLDAVTGHHHLHVGAVVGGEGGDLTGHIRGADVELGPVASEEGSVATAFFFLEDVDLTFELGVGLDRVRLDQHHAALDVFLLHTAQEQADVVSGHALVEQLAEHFHAGDGGFAGVLDAHDLDGFAHFHLATLDPAGGHGATTGDREDVFDSHQEGLVDLTLRLGDRLVDRIHQIEDLVDPLVLSTDALAAALDVLEGLEGGTGDDGDVITREVVAAEQLTHFQFDELEDFLVVDHVLLVEEHHQGGNAHLLGQQDVFLGLGHRAVGGGHHQDGAVHLGGTGDHVLDVVRVTRAVDVGVVTVFCFVLDVGRVDRDAPLLLFRSTIDVVVGLGLGLAKGSQHVGDGGSEGGLAVVDVPDGADVDVRFVPLKLLASH